jgi:hypothetical protein
MQSSGQKRLMKMGHLARRAPTLSKTLAHAGKDDEWFIGKRLSPIGNPQ